MIEILGQHLRQRLSNNTAHLEEVLAYFTPKTIKRNETLLAEGEICQYVYFIVKGCLQVYVMDKAGNESTREFYFEHNWVTDIFGFQNQFPSKEYIRSVEPSELLRIHYSHFQQLAQQVPQFEQVYKQILELSYANSVYRVNTLISMDALERIKWLMHHQPKILSRLSSKMVASYLGISPETMTRLKAKL